MIHKIKSDIWITQTQAKHAKDAFNFCHENKTNQCKVNTMTFVFDFENNKGTILRNAKSCFNRKYIDKTFFKYELK